MPRNCGQFHHRRSVLAQRLIFSVKIGQERFDSERYSHNGVRLADVDRLTDVGRLGKRVLLLEGRVRHDLRHVHAHPPVQIPKLAHAEPLPVSSLLLGDADAHDAALHTPSVELGLVVHHTLHGRRPLRHGGRPLLVRNRAQRFHARQARLPPKGQRHVVRVVPPKEGLPARQRSGQFLVGQERSQSILAEHLPRLGRRSVP
mmetsp:Transcript_41820/g.77407  ORF Transcript_41820/g.77407 Transcript_41820/m.77407 type:complete len:202 (-) Transcript_41820:407-1012(-)